MTVVVDAAMAMAWLFGEERTDATDAAFQRVVDDETFVPTLWHLEVANSLWSAIRRRRCDETYAVQSLERLRRLNFLTDGETGKHAWGRTRELAARHQISVYDAAYLELAMRRQGTLATLDTGLAKSARGVGLDVISN